MASLHGQSPTSLDHCAVDPHAMHGIVDGALRALLVDADVGVAVFGLDGRFVLVNDRLAELHGVPAADHIGCRIGEVVPRLEAQGEAALARARAGEHVTIEVSGPAPTGVARTCTEAWFPARDALGSVVGVVSIVRDTTQHARARKALVEAYAHLEALFDHLPVCVAIYDRNLCAVRINRLAAEVNDIDTSAAVGKHVSQIFPSAWTTIRPCYERALRGERFVVEVDRAAAGAVYGPGQVSVAYGPVRVDGAVEGVVVCAVDITERIQRSRELSTAYAQLQSIFDNVPVAIAVYDGDLRVTRMNERMAEWSGADPQTAAGMRASEILGPLWSAVEPCYARALEGERCMCEIDRRSLGQLRGPANVVTTYLPVRAGDAVIGVTATVTDISDRVLHERAIAAAEERYRLLTEHARDIVYRIRLVPSPGRVEFLSPAVQTLLGYSPEDYYADPALMTRTVHPDDRALFEQLLRDPMSVPMPLLLRLVRRDGTMRWHEQSVTAIFGSDGQPIAIEGISRDVTRRIALEREREELIAETETQGERDRIARDLHDGVMQTLYGIGLNLHGAERFLPPEASEARLIVDDAVFRLREAITDIRAYVMGLRPERLDEDLASAVKTLVDELRADESLDASLYVPEALPALNDEQRMALFHIVREALSNVRRHGRANRLNVDIIVRDGRLELCVQDDGIGFDVHRPVAVQHLGLVNIAARAHAIGADLVIDSTPGQGTALRLALPLERGSSGPAAARHREMAGECARSVTNA